MPIERVPIKPLPAPRIRESDIRCKAVSRKHGHQCEKIVGHVGKPGPHVDAAGHTWGKRVAKLTRRRASL